jgi:hypothetical protein
VALLLLLGVVAGVFWTGGGWPGGSSRNAVFHVPQTVLGSPTPRVQSPTPAKAPEGTESRSVAPPRPTRAAVPNPSLNPSASPVPFGIQAMTRTVCTNQDPQVREFTLTVIAVSDGAELSAATAYWSPPPESKGPMAVEGPGARSVIKGLTGQAVTWSVAATSVHATQTRTEPISVPNP